MQKKFGQHIILLIYSSILELKFPAPYLNFWAWHCLFDLVGVALKTMEISSQTQQLHCTVHCSPKMNKLFCVALMMTVAFAATPKYSTTSVVTLAGAVLFQSKYLPVI